MKKITKMVFIQLTILALFTTSVINSEALEVTWNIGDNFEYQFRVRDFLHITYVDWGTEYESEFKLDTTFQANITNINNITKYVDYDIIGLGTSGNSESYDAQDFVDNTEDLTIYMDISIFYDLVNNRTGIQDFNYDLHVMMFLEPNWSIINNAFVTALNTSTIVDTIADPYDPIIHNITFGDILGLMSSYTINGVKDDINAAIATFTADRTSWSFLWDASNGIEYSYDNGSHTLYKPMEKFIITNELGYTSEGIMDYYKRMIDIEFTTEDGDIIEIIQLVEYGLGQLTPTDESNFAYLIVIPAIASVFVTAVIFKRRK